MLSFKRMKTLQKFASIHAHVHNHFDKKGVSLIAGPTTNVAPLVEWRSVTA